MSCLRSGGISHYGGPFTPGENGFSVSVSENHFKTRLQA